MKRLGAGLALGLLCGAAVVARPAWDGPKAAPEKPKGLSEKVVAAWKKAGADVSWTGKGDVPEFWFTKKPEGGWEKLPAVEQPFGVRLLTELTKDADLKGIAALKHLESLILLDTQVTDKGLKELAGLKQLWSLGLLGAQVTDKGLKELVGLEQLQSLSLGDTKVTGAGLRELAGLKQLRFLRLGHTQVTDKGLKELAALKQLEYLDLGGAKVTDAGVRQLQKALPGLRVER